MNRVARPFRFDAFVLISELRRSQPRHDSQAEQECLHVTGQLPRACGVVRHLPWPTERTITRPEPAQQQFQIRVAERENRGRHRFLGRPLADDPLLFGPTIHATADARRGCISNAFARARVPRPLTWTESRVFTGVDADFHPAAMGAMVDARYAAGKLIGNGHEIVDQEPIVVVEIKARRVAGVSFGKQIGQRRNLVLRPATATPDMQLPRRGNAVTRLQLAQQRPSVERP